METKVTTEATKAAQENSHKMLAILLKRAGGKTTVTLSDLEQLHAENVIVLTHFHEKSIDLELISVNDALALVAMQEGNSRSTLN